MRSKRNHQHGQYELSRGELLLEEERTRCFRGTIKIDIEHLHFGDPDFREIDESNVQRLIDVFEQEGCRRLRPDHHIPAIVDDNVLRTWLGEGHQSGADLLSRDPSHWPFVRLRNGTLRVLHGRHRITAARQYLVGQDRWWAVDVYTAGKDLLVPAT